ncbi:MAG TPA: amidase [Solirubrobacteraceae bacterium]|jgi:aspartyl-tRNA(Asn)/glutamyl-tRNA(Gln) amidotransferase subunit A
MSGSLAALSLRESVAGLRAGEITPAELLEACLARVEATQELGAFVAVDADGARRQAHEPQPAPLHGVPIAIKDLVDVSGLPTRGGTHALDDAPPAAADAAVVAGLRARGAIPVGKTATHELGSGVTTPAVRNPRRPDLTAGGSSGGSAAAVAVGAVPIALGTDTAGSVRIPAACCGICGLIGRNGRLPMDGVLANSRSFDTLGVLVREPGDLPLAWHALSGAAPGERALSTVLVCGGEALGRVDDSELAAAAVAVEELGLPVRELPLGPLREWAPLRAIVIDDESLHAHRQAGLYPAKDPGHAVGEELAEAHAHAERRPASEVDAARARLAELGGELHAALGDGCVLVLPALAMAPPPRELPDSQVIGRLSRLVAPMNIAGLASAVIPIDGTGVQLAGRDEDTVLAAVARLTT